MGDSLPCRCLPKQGTLPRMSLAALLAHGEQAGRKQLRVPEKQVCQNFKGI